MVTSCGKLQSSPPPQGSAASRPLRITCPSRIRSRSPGPATIRLMKFTSACARVGWLQTSPCCGLVPHWLLRSAPPGGWKTTMSPTLGSPKCMPTRLTRTRWPTSSVGTIDSLGMRYGLTRKAWIPSARPSATATMSTSSNREPEADERLVFTGLLGLVVGDGLGLRRGLDLGRLGLGERLLVDRLAWDLRVRLRGRLGGGIVQQARLNRLLRADVAALAHPRALADAPAEVVELGAPDVAARGHVDLLDLRRVHRERALHADAERVLAHRERLAHALAL